MRSIKLCRTDADCAEFIERSFSERGDAVRVGVTIGNFDGMHAGHQQLGATLIEALRVRPGPSIPAIMTFHPHPRQLLTGVARREIHNHPELWTITTLRQKVDLADAAGFRLFFAPRFSRSFASLDAETFVRRFLVGALRAEIVVIGYDWAFGRGRNGTPELLARLGENLGFETIVVPPYEIHGIRVSSTAVKEAIRRADFASLGHLLGREYALSGRVRHGDKRGRLLGFPTANLDLAGQILPPDGVYATWAVVAGKRLRSVTSIGVRPTFGEGRRLVEVHIMDPGAYNLYNSRIDLRFVSFLRPQARFEGEAALIQAMTADIAAAQTVFAKIAT